MTLVDGTLDKEIEDSLVTGRRTLTAREYRSFKFVTTPLSRVVLEFAHSLATAQDWSIRIAVLRNDSGSFVLQNWPDRRTWASIPRFPMRIVVVGSGQSYDDEKPATVFGPADASWEIWTWSVQGADNEFHLEVVETLDI